MPLRLTGLWRHPDFMKLWAGQTVSELGSRITRDGLPLTAVLVLRASPFEMGLLSAVGAAPVIVVGLAAGVWVDRLRRRPVLIAADLARAVLLATIPAAVLLGALNMDQLYVVAALTGVLTLLFDVAYQSYLPSLVERDNVAEGNSKLALSSSAAEIAGPGLAGVLVQAVTAPIAILLDAVSFVFSAASLALIRKPEPAPSPPEARQDMWRDVGEGLHLVLGQPLLRALAASAGILSFSGNFIGPLYTLYAIRELGMGPAALGMTIAVGGVGSLIGALLAGWTARRLGLGATFVGMLAVVGAARLLIPLARGPLIVVLAFLMAGQLLGDAAHTIYFVHEISLRQAITPDRLLGRTNASVQLLEAGVGPLGALVGGALGGIVGLRPTLVLAALGGLVACLPLLLSPVRGLRGYPRPLA